MRRLARPAQYLALLAYIIFLGFPLLWLISASFKSSAELNSLSISLIPRNFTLDNYPLALERQGLVSSAFNSLVVALGSTLLVILISIPAAYVLARIKGKVRAVGVGWNPQTLSVNVDSEHVKESVQFIEYFTNTENLAAVNKADALIPATTSAQEALAKEMQGETGWDNILKSGSHMTDAPYLFADAYAQWKDTVATPAFQRYLANEIDKAGLQKALTDGWDQVNR